MTAEICSFTTTTSRESAGDARASAILLSATLLHLYRDRYAALLFNSSAPVSSSQSGKPLVYLYIKLILIDIRATIPTLLDVRSELTFESTCGRLTASYDILVAFIGYLLRSLDEDDAETQDTRSSLLPPDLILQLRTDIAEAMSVTVEYMRDRFDVQTNTQNAQQAITPSSSSHQPANQPLSLPWHSADNTHDINLAAAQIRALSLWLREDDNEKLCTEAATIIDVLLVLYNSLSSNELRSPIVLALEGILTTPEATETFFAHSGWTILSADLTSTLLSSPTPEAQQIRAIEIIRLLLAAVESTPQTAFRKEWLGIIPVSAQGPVSATSIESVERELWIAAWQLVVEVLDRAPVGTRRERIGEVRRIMEIAKGWVGEVRDGGEHEGLGEVLEGLGGLFPGV